jgi:hypothetical protein
MQLSITYKELENQILRRYNTTINISVTDDKTICVSRKIIPFLPAAELKIHITGIEGTDVFLSYDGGFITNKVINGIILFVKEKLATQVGFTGQDCAVVHLANIKDSDKVFNSVELKDIIFDTEKINLHFEFNN